MFSPGSGSFVLVLIFAIPIVAIVGGITASVLKTQGEQRLIELAQRERIAAIERGLDLSKLPPFPMPAGSHEVSSMYMSPRQASLHRAQGLLIGGLVTLAVGVGISLMLYFLGGGAEAGAWAVGLVPGFVGVGLLISSMIVRNGAPGENRGPNGPGA